MRELCNAFVRRSGGQPTVPQMMQIYRALSSAVPELKQRAGAQSLFEARMFADLRLLQQASLSIAATSLS